MGSYARLARRALETEMPVMVQIQELVRGAKNVISLAQGVVYWQPPKEAMEKVKELIWEPSVSRYGADEGIPELREALLQKQLRRENKLVKSSVMVTAGANQAFVNLVLALCDAGDSAVMFAPYYIQDNIPICASIISQHLALHSIEMGGAEWVTERVKGLVKNKEIIEEALSPLGENAVKGGEGAIYLWARLPEKYEDDGRVVHWLANRHGVVVIPGGACGCPGHLRIAFGGLVEDECRAAGKRLKLGLEELVRDGMVE
ncbi:Aromatic aminotransferase ISS1 [Linum perenne]